MSSLTDKRTKKRNTVQGRGIGTADHGKTLWLGLVVWAFYTFNDPATNIVKRDGVIDFKWIFSLSIPIQARIIIANKKKKKKYRELFAALVFFSHTLNTPFLHRPKSVQMRFLLAYLMSVQFLFVEQSKSKDQCHRFPINEILNSFLKCLPLPTAAALAKNKTPRYLLFV